MFFPPMIMSRLEKSALLRASPGLGAPIMVRAAWWTDLVCVCACVDGLHGGAGGVASECVGTNGPTDHPPTHPSINLASSQVAMTGLCLSFSTPLCCALFPQEASIKLEEVRA